MKACEEESGKRVNSFQGEGRPFAKTRINHQKSHFHYAACTPRPILHVARIYSVSLQPVNPWVCRWCPTLN